MENGLVYIALCLQKIQCDRQIMTLWEKVNENRRKKIMRGKGLLSLALAAALTVSMAPLPMGTVHAEAAEPGSTMQTEQTDTAAPEDASVQNTAEGVIQETSEESGIPDNEELLDGYVSRILGTDAGVAPYANWGEQALNDQEKAIYDVLKAKAVDVAANGGSTQDMLSGGTAVMRWSYEELGEGSQSYYAGAVREKLRESMRKVVDVLMADCPYEMYWYDKTIGWQYSYGMSADDSGVTVSLSEMAFTVAEAYRADGNQYMVDASKAQSAAAAVETAKTIVEKYRNAADYEKLLGYKNEICALTEYNSNAASDITMAYGDPWQLIYVFDGDPGTTVVCEGYAKAFQYLCDLTTFVSPDIVCYTVSGAMSGGPHMWNIVTMPDGYHYLVDVTNSDSGTVGANGGLFLAGYDRELTDGYLVHMMSYFYDDDTKNSYGTGEDSILKLSSASYDPEVDYTLDVIPAWVFAHYGTSFRLEIVADPDETVKIMCNGNQIGEDIKPNEYGRAVVTINTLEEGLTPSETVTAEGNYWKEYHMVAQCNGGLTTHDVFVEVDYADSGVTGIVTPDPNVAGWYRTAPVITPPEGYTIASTANTDTQWGGQIQVQGEGSSVSSIYYLRNADTGAITRCEDTYKVDTAAPTGVKAAVSGEGDNSLTVTVSAEDAGSGIKNYGLTYVSGGSKAPVITDKGNGVFEVTGLDPRTEYTFQATAADNADNAAALVVSASTTGKANPEVGQVTYSGGTIYSTTDPSEVVLEKTGSIEGTLKLQAGTVFTAGTHEYVWVFTPTDTENYNTVSGAITLEIAADPAVSVDVSGTPDKTQYSYRDAFDPAGLTVEVTYGSGAVREIPLSDLEITYENGEFMKIGDCSVTLSYTYDGGKVSFDVTGLSVSAREVKDPVIILEKDSYTYDGKAKTPGVTVKDGDVVIPANEYTVTYADNVKVGTATVTIKDAEGGNYVIAEKTVKFTISEKAAGPADSDKNDKKSDKDKAVKTGDSMNPAVWVLMLAVSAVAVGAAITRRRERR